MRSLMLIPVALLLWSGAACGSEDGDDESAPSSTVASASTVEEGAPASGGSFCDAAEAFAVAQADGPDATGPDEVEATVTAMSDAASELAATAPDGVTGDAEAFAAAIDGLAQYAADRQFEVDLGGAAPEYQSGEGQAVVGAISDSIGAVDQAVQDECGHFINEVP